MKKLIAAITVSFMMLGLVTGCGAEKNFDGDILEVISFDMSKQEVMEAAGKAFGEIKYMGADGKPVENSDDADRLIYSLNSVYGYEGNIIFVFKSDLNSLHKAEIFYMVGDNDGEKQYEDIVDQFTDLYGTSVTDGATNRYMSYKGNNTVVADYSKYSATITVQYGPSDNWEEWMDF